MSSKIVYTCDRCGATFEDRPKADEISHRLYTVNKCFVDTQTDICPKCSESLHRWMEQEPESGTHTIYLNVHRNDDGRPKTFKNKKKRWWQI